MSFLSGLSNIFHSIGHVLSGGDDTDQQKKKQNAPVKVVPIKSAPTQNVVTQLNQPQQQSPVLNPNLNLTPLQKVNSSQPQVGSYTSNSPLAKLPAPQASQPQAPPDKNSVGYKLTHNAVTNLAGSIVKPTVEFGHAALEVPHAIVREVQNKPINDIQQNVFGTTDSGTIAKKIIGDTVNTALLGAAPGVDNLAGKGAAKLLPDATNVALKKIVPKVASGAVQGSAFGANSTAENGGSVENTLKSAGVNALVGGATAGFFSGIPVLAKAVQDGRISSQEADQATRVDTGVHTVNPNRPTDAAAQLGVQDGVQGQPISPVDNTPAFQRSFGTPEPTNSRDFVLRQKYGDLIKANPKQAPQLRAHLQDLLSTPLPKVVQGEIPAAPVDVSPTSVVSPETSVTPVPQEASSTPVQPPVQALTVAQLGSDATRPAGDIQKAIEDAHNSGDNVKAAQLIETLPDEMKAPVRSALGIPEPTTPVEQPVASSKKVTTAPNAPGVRAAAQKKLDSLAGNAGDPTTHDILSNKDLLEAGKAHADTFNDSGLVNQYKNGFNPTDAADVAKGHAALERLNQIAKANPANKDAAKAIDNILAGAEQGFSKGGRTVNYAQQFYDGLKGPAKTSYLIRSIDKVREANSQPLLRDDEAAMKAATDKVQSHVDVEEANKAKIATIQSRLEEIKAEIAQAAAEGKQVPKALTKEGDTLKGAVKDHQAAISKNTADLGKFYDSVAPAKFSKGQQAGDLGRSLMLSSLAGRGNDIATTGINSAHQLLQKSIAANLGKVANKVTGKAGGVIDTGPSVKAIAHGMKYGLKKSVQRFKGNVAAGDANSLLKKATDGSGKGQLLSRSNGSLLSKITAPVHRVVRSATEVATDLSEGIKESHMQQLATQQGKQLGLTGENLKAHVAATTASPSKAMVEAGDRLRDEVNNMQDNGLSTALEKGTKAISEHIPYVGEQIRNMVLPFTRWTGGAIHNAVMDKNVVANVAQLTKAAVKGDQQGMITAVSKLGVNGVASIGAGYTLAKAGLLTHENAQGYNDDGVYLHVGGRYVPAGFLGFFAPGLIMGSAAHDAMSDPKNKGSFVKTIADATGKTLVNSYHALGGESLTGESNPVLQAIMDPKNHGGGAGVGATIGGQVAGQYVPAVTGDVNAVLNNGIPGIKGSDALNPTHEAALTKVEKGSSGTLTKAGKPSTAKDVPRSVVNQLLNKVPVVSQNLPRNKGVAANDEFDRLTRGDRDTQTEIKAKADTAAKAATAADLVKRGVPDPNATYKAGDSFTQAVENRVENKKYDQAIEGLKANLKKVQSGPDVTTKQTDPIEKQIKTIQVLKDGNFDPKVRDTYSGTTLAEWRAMGDPTSDSYDKAKYDDLYAYDKALADAGVSSSTKDGFTQKYTLKGASKATAKGSAAIAKKVTTSNTLGNTPSFATIDLSNLSPKKIATTVKIPTIQQVKSGDLIKKRAISVSKTKG